MVVLLAVPVLFALGQNAAPAEAPVTEGRTLVVATDGSSPYRSVQAALDALPAGNAGPVTLRIQPGTYTERIVIPKDRPRLRLVGEDAARTMLTFNLNATSTDAGGRPVGTMRSTSTTVRANDFSAENLTFANTTPRDVAQAVALATTGDRQVFRRCRFLGWQDTLYLGAGRHYFEECYLEGGVDFIFGPGTAVFKNCEVRSKRHGYVTAASTPRDAAHGFVFVGCRLTAAAGLADQSVYLGRPWRDHASVTLVNCAMGSHIHAEGWSIWKGTERHQTARYAEYGSTGPGAVPAARVRWLRQLGEEEAKSLTVRAVLGGRDGWDPAAAKPKREPPSPSEPRGKKD